MPEKETRDHAYLRWVRTQRCCVCGDDTSVEAHHLRVATIGKASPGFGQKSSDRWAIPLCGRHHREAHSMGEQSFWASLGIDPVALSMHYHADYRGDPLLHALEKAKGDKP